MENHPLISVIVPVYNVEAYLDRCVGSIVNQTYRELEILLVDDGSPDRCPRMCDEWAQKDRRIRVLHVENGGAGKARNLAIRQAAGAWTVLVDGDDYLHSRMIGYLYGLLDETTDLAECCIVHTGSDEAVFSDITDADEIVACRAEEALGYLIDDRMFRQTPPNKLYKTDIIKRIPFPEGKLIDDEFWTYRVIGQCRRLKHSSLKLYAYRQQSGSVMHKPYSVRRLHALDAKYERLDYIEQNYPALLPKARTNFLESCIYQGQMTVRHLAGNEKREAEAKIRDYFDRVRLTQEEKRTLKGTHRIWLSLARLSLFGACRLKNALKIGI